MRKFLLAATLMLAAPSADAQTPAHDPTATLQSVLPADVFTRVSERIAQARSRQLPAQALEHRALELAAKGASPEEIEQRVDGYAKAMELAKDALERGRGRPAQDAEIAAGGDVIARGVDGSQVAEMARIAPADRTIAVSLYVLGAMIERGMSMQNAFAKVTAGLANRVTDAELEAELQALPAVVAERKPAVTGPGAGAANRPASAGAPAGVPANPGTGATPPVTPPVRGRPPIE